MNWSTVKSIKITEGDVKSLSINSQVVWKKKEAIPIPPQEPVTDKSFRFENKSATPTTLHYGATGVEDLTGRTHDNIKMIYSKDGTEWSRWNWDSSQGIFEKLTIGPGEKLYIRGLSDGISGYLAAWWHFIMSGSLECIGNMDDLSTGTNVKGQYAGVFSQCPITSLPTLPTRTVGTFGLYGLFANCNNIKDVSSLKLPVASEDATHMYARMFVNCANLEQPISSMPNSSKIRVGACEAMYMNCVKLKNVSKVSWQSNDFLAESAFEEMYAGCKLELVHIDLSNAFGAVKRFDKRCCKGMFKGAGSTHPSWKTRFTKWFGKDFPSIDNITYGEEAFAEMFMNSHVQFDYEFELDFTKSANTTSPLGVCKRMFYQAKCEGHMGNYSDGVICIKGLPYSNFNANGKETWPVEQFEDWIGFTRWKEDSSSDWTDEVAVITDNMKEYWMYYTIPYGPSGSTAGRYKYTMFWGESSGITIRPHPNRNTSTPFNVEYSEDEGQTWQSAGNIQDGAWSHSVDSTSVLLVRGDLVKEQYNYDYEIVGSGSGPAYVGGNIFALSGIYTMSGIQERLSQNNIYFNKLFTCTDGGGMWEKVCVQPINLYLPYYNGGAYNFMFWIQNNQNETKPSSYDAYSIVISKIKPTISQGAWGGYSSILRDSSGRNLRKNTIVYMTDYPPQDRVVSDFATGCEKGTLYIEEGQVCNYVPDTWDKIYMCK